MLNLSLNVTKTSFLYISIVMITIAIRLLAKSEQSEEWILNAKKLFNLINY